MSYQAEYIWIDGTEPSPLLRSKTRIVADGKDPGIWGFDGSSTNQALGHDSDCVLRPVFTCPDPLRGPNDKLVMCEVLLTDFTPHPTNTRAACAAAAEKYADQEPVFGIEQEYTFLRIGPSHGLAGQGLPRAPGAVLLRRGRRQDAGTRHRRAAHGRLHGGRSRHRGHQRRGDDGPVGVPGRCPFAAADGRTSSGWPAGCCSGSPRTSACSPPWSRSRSWVTGTVPVPTPTSRPRPMREEGGWDAIIAGCEALGKNVEEHVEELRRRDHRTADGSPRDGALVGIQLRDVRPGGVDPDPVGRGQGQEGLAGGPASQRQHGSVHGDPPDGDHGVRGRGGGHDLREAFDVAPASTGHHREAEGAVNGGRCPVSARSLGIGRVRGSSVPVGSQARSALSLNWSRRSTWSSSS